MLYGGGPATWYDPWVKKFEASFPGVTVTVKAGSSNVLADEIDTQIKAGRLQVDTAFPQTIQDYECWKHVRRFSTGERIVFLPYTEEMYLKTQAWIHEHGILEGQPPAADYAGPVAA